MFASLTSRGPAQVRAWGLFLNDVCDRLAEPTNGDAAAADALRRAAEDCVKPSPAARPAFSKLSEMLAALL